MWAEPQEECTFAQDVCVRVNPAPKLNSMEVRPNGKNIEVYNLKNFDLSQTLDCGQCFRWENLNGKYQGIALGKIVTVYQEDTKIVFENVSVNDFKNIWINYFDLNADYEKISEKFLGINSVMDSAVKECAGIRILRQEPWEVLCSFIISQNNNIPRIKKIIRLLCAHFGDDIDGGYSFPTAQKLAALHEEDLSPIRAGFRARYILDAAKKVASGVIDFDVLEKMPKDEAKNMLTQIKGVGTKVADCVLLYGMNRLSAFPMDVWMKRVMDKFFPSKSSDFFGKYAGIAQQYLYHYSRSHPEIFE